MSSNPGWMSVVYIPSNNKKGSINQINNLLEYSMTTIDIIVLNNGLKIMVNIEIEV